ncbi:MAG: hypothetical protein MJ231_04005 [bacterium]|nr:hypothetical protein [bacterium]
MVNGINNNCPASGIYLDNPQKQNKIVKKSTNPIDNYTMAGLESLGIYNMSLVKNKENFDHKPAEVILNRDVALSDVQGEKVTDPFGTIEYVVQKDDKFETRYYPSDVKGKENNIYKIEVIDIETGKLLKDQYNYQYGNGISVTEYSPDEPNVSYTTSYEDGEIDYVERHEELPNGSHKSYSKNFYSDVPNYELSVSDKNYDNYIGVNLDADCMVKNINVSRKMGNVDYDKDITLNKGAIINIRENVSKDITVPNYMERDVIDDADVKPADKYDKTQMEQLAKNNLDNKSYSLYGNGSIREYYDGNTKVEFKENGTQIIKEYYDKDTIKTTIYHDDGSYHVEYKKGDLIKSLYVDKNNKPSYYDVEQNGKRIKSVSFSKEGYLQYND